MSRKLFCIGGLAAVFSIIYTALLIINTEATESVFVYQIIAQANYFHAVTILFLATLKREYLDFYMSSVSWYFLSNIIGMTLISSFAWMKVGAIDYEVLKIFSIVWFGLLSVGWFVLMKSVMRLKISLGS
jgi:hypothetical protein|tara:strand:- start:289 stop:678 length:390 start_codon:yes stop_codon:yes gene_type:complete